MDSDQHVRPSPVVRWTHAGSEIIVLSLASGRFYTFNSSGRVMWTALAAGGSIQAIAGAVARHYTSDPVEMLSDVRAFCDDVVKKGLAEVRAGSAEDHRTSNRASATSGSRPLMRTTINLAGHVFAFNVLRDVVSHHIWLRRVAEGRWEPRLLATIIDLVRPGDICVDAGSWIGPYALLCSRLVGSTGKVYAVEPDFTARRLLEDNLRANDCHNVVVDGRALSHAGGTVWLRGGPEAADSNARTAVVQHPASLAIDCVSLSDCCRGHGIVPDVLKIDTEGAEIAIVQGAGDVLRNARILIVEVHRQYLAREGVEASTFIHDVNRRRGAEGVPVEECHETLTVLWRRAAFDPRP